MYNGLIIWLTLTTCHRPELFVKTVQSIRANVTDLALVDHWLIVDDHTPSQRHATMQAALNHLRTPVTWVWKRGRDPKGHAHSMNVIRTRVLQAVPRVHYVFHWEDDWHLVRPDAYVLRTIRALDARSTLGQVLINAHYQEVGEDHDGPVVPLDPDGNTLVHVWDPHDRRRGTMYWPHYALRPGMLRRHVWDVVGAYHEQHPHFEREYADRYFHTHGFQTGFLAGVNALHLGKKTWETESQVPSAYALNNVSRF